MRLALYQGPSPAGDIAVALRAVEHTLVVARAAGADIALMPELFLPGYNVAEMATDTTWPEQLSMLIRQQGVALAIGLAEYADGELRNTARLFAADGTTLACYYKRQLYGPREVALFTPGNDIIHCDYQGRRIGLLICYDVEFPELVRAQAQAGTEVLLVPTAITSPFETVSRFLVPARAMENGLAIAYANYCGVENDLHYCGHSLIVGPDGMPVAQAGSVPAVLIADLPTAADLRPLSTQLEDLNNPP